MEEVRKRLGQGMISLAAMPSAAMSEGQFYPHEILVCPCCKKALSGPFKKDTKYLCANCGVKIFFAVWAETQTEGHYFVSALLEV